MIVVEQHPFTFSAVVATTLDVLLPSAWEGACEVREAASTSALSHGQAIAIQIGGCGRPGGAKHTRTHPRARERSWDSTHSPAHDIPTHRLCDRDRLLLLDLERLRDLDLERLRDLDLDLERLRDLDLERLRDLDLDLDLLLERLLLRRRRAGLRDRLGLRRRRL